MYACVVQSSRGYGCMNGLASVDSPSPAASASFGIAALPGPPDRDATGGGGGFGAGSGGYGLSAPAIAAFAPSAILAGAPATSMSERIPEPMPAMLDSLVFNPPPLASVSAPPAASEPLLINPFAVQPDGDPFYPPAIAAEADAPPPFDPLEGYIFNDGDEIADELMRYIMKGPPTSN